MADDNELEKLLEDLTEFTDRPNNNTLAELLGKLAFLIVKEGKHVTSSPP